MEYGTRDFTQEELFRFLDNLRESGQINMYGAPKVLQQQFGFDRRTSHELFQDWADNWNPGCFEEAKKGGSE